MRKWLNVVSGFAVAVEVGLVTAYIVQGPKSSLLPPSLLVIFVCLSLLALRLSDSEWPLSLAWRVYQIRYMRDLLRDPFISQWGAGFGRIELILRHRGNLGAQVMIQGERKPLVESLKRLVNERKYHPMTRVMVLGDPGSGKTSGLEQLTFELATASLRRFASRRRIPILVRLSNFQDGKLIDYVAETARNRTSGKRGAFVSSRLTDLFQRGSVILLFDGLDEALGERRDRVLGELSDLVESQLYAHVPIVITCRTREDPSGRLPGMHVFEIQDLDDRAVQAFISRYRGLHDARKVWDALLRDDLLNPRALGRNPFWLKLIIECGVFYGNKAQILSGAITSLLTREWQKPNVERSWRRVLTQENQLDETKRGLAWLAYQMSIRSVTKVSKDPVVSGLNGWLGSRAGVEGLSPQDIIGLGEDAELLEYRSDMIQFRHRLLQEFLTAWALTHDSDLQEFWKGIKLHADDTSWWETILLVGKLIPDSSALVQVILGSPMSTRRALLAAALIKRDATTLMWRPVILGYLRDQLRQGMQTADRDAAQALARIAGDDLAQVIGEILTLDRSMNAGATELVTLLAALGSDKALDLLRELDIEIASELLMEMHMWQAAELLRRLGVTDALSMLSNARIMPADAAARLIGALEIEMAIEILRALNSQRTTSILTHLDHQSAQRLLPALDNSTLVNILIRLKPSSVARILSMLDAPRATHMLKVLRTSSTLDNTRGLVRLRSSAPLDRSPRTAEIIVMLAGLDTHLTFEVLRRLGNRAYRAILSTLADEELGIVLRGYRARNTREVVQLLSQIAHKTSSGVIRGQSTRRNVATTVDRPYLNKSGGVNDSGE